MICRNIIDGVEIYAFGFTPADDQWEKFLAYVRNNAPPETAFDLQSVYVGAQHNEYGLTFNISCTAFINMGEFIPEDEINALELEDGES